MEANRTLSHRRTLGFGGTARPPSASELPLPPPQLNRLAPRQPRPTSAREAPGARQPVSQEHMEWRRQQMLQQASGAMGGGVHGGGAPSPRGATQLGIAQQLMQLMQQHPISQGVAEAQGTPATGRGGPGAGGFK